MAYSNYQHGFKSGVTIRGVPIELSHPGRVFWVGNNVTRLDNEKTAADGNDGSFLAPFSTLEGALNNTAVVASRGDVLFVRPGFTLTIGTATALNFDKAGVAIVGLGMGTSRPTITFATATTVTIPVTAANMSLRNFILRANLDNIVSVFTLTTASFFSVEDCLIDDTSAALHFQAIIDTSTVDNDADGLYFANNTRIGLAVAAFSMFLVDATQSKWTIKNNYLQAASVATSGVIVCAAAKTLTDLVVTDNFVGTLATDASTGIILSGGTTAQSLARGVVSKNQTFSLDVAGSGAVAVAVSYSKILKIENVIAGHVAAGTQVAYVTDGTARSQSG